MQNDTEIAARAAVEGGTGVYGEVEENSNVLLLLFRNREDTYLKLGDLSAKANKIGWHREALSVS